jgi:heterodisulfide reductase subunit A
LPRDGSGYFSPQEFLTEITRKVESNPLITVHLETKLAATSGFMGNFTSTLERVSPDPASPAPMPGDGANGNRVQVPHGVAVLCTGGDEYRGDEYGYGTSPNILTGLEFESLLAKHANGKGSEATGRPPKSVVMILCVGPAEEYCARICCTTALKNALALKRLDPSAQVTVLYKDIRTYGFKERLYTQARESGVVFIRYDDTRQPEVQTADGASPEVRVWEPRSSWITTVSSSRLMSSYGPSTSPQRASSWRGWATIPSFSRKPSCRRRRRRRARRTCCRTTAL